MGIYSGTVAFSRFRIMGRGKKPTIARLSELLDNFKAPVVKIDGSPKSELIGWVRPLTPQDPEVMGEDSHWDISDCQITGGIMLRVRYERRKIPMSLLQMLYKQKLSDHIKSTGKNLGRTDRQKLKEDIAAELLRRTLPQIQFTDVLWRDDENELYVYSGSKSVCERILQLFNQTFASELDLSLARLSTTTAWIESDESDMRLDRITKTEPAVFARHMS
jgi:DNA recombination-dependent growth factor C